MKLDEHYKLDKEKRYKFAGDVYEFDSDSPSWIGGERGWLQNEFQYFANAGLVTEVRELIAVEFEATVVHFLHDSVVSSPYTDQLAGKRVRVTVTEVQ